IANFVSNTVQVFLRKANGTFSAPASYNTGSGPVSLAVGDLTSSGKIDIVVVNQSDNSVQVLANDGTGKFTPGIAMLTGKRPTAVVLADFNGDGNLDMAVSHDLPSLLPEDQGVTVFLQKTDVQGKGNRT